MPKNKFASRRFAAAVAVAGSLCSLPASAGTFFQLQATNISVDIPSPLFTSSQITGYLEISNSVGPGGSFGPSQLESFVFDIDGYHFTQDNLDPTLRLHRCRWPHLGGRQYNSVSSDRL